MKFLAAIWDGGVQLVTGFFWFFIYVIKYNLFKAYEDEKECVEDQ
jgi:hypothetical protein